MLATRIKSPLLYQLSYRPKVSILLGKCRAWLGTARPIVPVVYPTRSSESSEDLFEAYRRAVGS